MAYVARGALDCFHMDGLKVWDIAAGTLIIREAGGTVIDTKGKINIQVLHDNYKCTNFSQKQTLREIY